MINNNLSSASGRDKGFTLIELMIVIAIIGILASVAVPNYFKFTQRAKFSEVITAASMFKLPATVAFVSNRVDDVTDLNAGIHGIPENLDPGDAVSPVVHTVTLINGVITASSTDDLGPETYTLTAQPVGGGVNWVAGGTCEASGLC